LSDWASKIIIHLCKNHTITHAPLTPDSLNDGKKG
jgi:hypothetical protein